MILRIWHAMTRHPFVNRRERYGSLVRVICTCSCGEVRVILVGDE